MRSSEIALPFWSDYCKRIFGEELPADPSVWTNHHYGGLNIKGENIFFANSSEDPWQWASMLEIQDPTEQAKMQVGYADCDACGHCSDLHIPTDTQAASLTQLQAEIADVVASWI